MNDTRPLRSYKPGLLTHARHGLLVGAMYLITILNRRELYKYRVISIMFTKMSNFMTISSPLSKQPVRILSSEILGQGTNSAQKAWSIRTAHIRFWQTGFLRSREA